ncbi:hypothetical protein T4B_5166 [Trichinella pseudospiralis]|uniref:Uncharacterized protein n=1 Tax=Trichinella pseudospiralis TaxID=6337 RepID=A0A0V1GFS6_TRIPS|nr:hypothetical protein T4B_13602 [Trichinella pseudospiralis]KRY97990.1 hypothetical protein T4B_5166 [Trichinella pseudospiralis]
MALRKLKNDVFYHLFQHDHHYSSPKMKGNLHAICCGLSS